MKHFVFLLYLVSYTTGIGAIALQFLNYLRYKQNAIKVFVLFDLCFTLVLIFDTLNYYFRTVVNYNSAWFQIVIILGLFFSSIGMAYFIGVLIGAIINKGLSKTFKIILWGGSLLTFSILILLYIFNQNRIITGFMAFQTGFTITTIFIFFAIGYNLYLLSLNLNRIGIQEKRFVRMTLIAVLVLLLAAILSNFILYQVHLKYPIAFSPLIYFIINLATVISFTRNFNSGMPDDLGKPCFDKGECPLKFHTAIIKEHNITDRELDVLQLILDGCSNHEIGKKLFISSNTVRNHIYKIFKKFGVKSRYQLIKIFTD